MNRRFQFAVVAASTCIVGLLLFGTVKVRSAPPEEPYTQLGVYSDVLTKIKVEYVEEPDIKAVTLGAINGLLESLDPFASYLNADQYKQYEREHDPGKPNVGLLLSRGPGYLRVVNVIPGSAADKAKLSTGDIIESINKISTRDMPLAFAELLMQGEADSVVELDVLTPRQSDPESMKLTRGTASWPAVQSRMITEKGTSIGYVASSTLQPGRLTTVRQRIQDLERQGAKSLILDLRNNSTGPVEEGIALADLFMDSGVITYVEGQKQPKKESMATAANTITKLPLVVLTNRGTAGAAEVASAALLDSSRATVVGEPTFGNAAVRKAITLGDGSAVILATAKYYSPSGKAIQDERVTPKITQLQFDAVAENADGTSSQTPKDLILDRGLITLTEPVK